MTHSTGRGTPKALQHSWFRLSDRFPICVCRKCGLVRYRTESAMVYGRTVQDFAQRLSGRFRVLEYDYAPPCRQTLPPNTRLFEWISVGVEAINFLSKRRFLTSEYGASKVEL